MYGVEIKDLTGCPRLGLTVSRTRQMSHSLLYGILRVSICDACWRQGNRLNRKPGSYIDLTPVNPIIGKRLRDQEAIGAFTAPVCATRTIHGSPDLSHSSFETLLARLTSESCGLSQNELFRLFCQTVREFFGASGVCCCRAAIQGTWSILESAGHSTWGMQGEVLTSSVAESLAQAQRTRKTIVCRITSQ